MNPVQLGRAAYAFFRMAEIEKRYRKPLGDGTREARANAAIDF
jgi:hypothetical protein